MLLQGAVLGGIGRGRGFGQWATGAVLLGAGTAMVYPTLLAAIGDIAPPAWRGSAVGAYRLWRDLGYVAGALLAGTLADAFGLTAAVTLIAAVTAGSGALVALRMPETHRPGRRGSAPGQ